MSYDPLDCFESGLSSCCQARVMIGPICSRCKEHCDVEVDDPAEREFSPEQQAIIDRLEKEGREP